MSEFAGSGGNRDHAKALRPNVERHQVHVPAAVTRATPSGVIDHPTEAELVILLIMGRTALDPPPPLRPQGEHPWLQDVPTIEPSLANHPCAQNLVLPLDRIVPERVRLLKIRPRSRPRRCSGNSESRMLPSAGIADVDMTADFQADQAVMRLRNVRASPGAEQEVRCSDLGLTVPRLRLVGGEEP